MEALGDDGQATRGVEDVARAFLDQQEEVCFAAVRIGGSYFTEVQLLRRSRAAGGLPSRRKLERGPKATKHAYALRGRVRCGYCQRKMEGTPRETRIYYRCAARTIVPGSPLLAEHPENVYLPEAALLELSILETQLSTPGRSLPVQGPPECR
jgi:hypothetical protein